ncbi:MAG: hypothetical protein OHM56_11345 [Spiroplasma phoeniceum]|nr:MAG: hypothetical protein OHM57_10765 [Spiroplasma phoeniceum]UZQ32143.1 MAG: hypothetical protein OHM56_11345 [Spiroplasma phoeniceum]
MQRAFRKKEGSLKAANLIVAITDKDKGALKILADKSGYQTFVIPDDIGGRYSVLTPVGIFAMLVIGINVNNVFKEAQQSYQP